VQEEAAQRHDLSWRDVSKRELHGGQWRDQLPIGAETVRDGVYPRWPVLHQRGLPNRNDLLQSAVHRHRDRPAPLRRLHNGLSVRQDLRRGSLLHSAAGTAVHRDERVLRHRRLLQRTDAQHVHGVRAEKRRLRTQCVLSGPLLRGPQCERDNVRGLHADGGVLPERRVLSGTVLSERDVP
jgi:hypothetical protein